MMSSTAGKENAQGQARLMNPMEYSTHSSSGGGARRSKRYRDNVDDDNDDDDDDDFDEEDLRASLPHSDELLRDSSRPLRPQDPVLRQQKIYTTVSVIAMVVALAFFIATMSVRTKDNNNNNNGGIVGSNTGNDNNAENDANANAPVTRDIPVVPNAGHEWQQLGFDISGQYQNGAFGYSVSLSADGDRMAVSSPFYDASKALALNNDNADDDKDKDDSQGPTDFTGLTNVFYWDSNSRMWLPSGNEILGDNRHDRTGYTLSLSSNGRRLAVASGYGYGGSVQVYQDDQAVGSTTSQWDYLGEEFGVRTSQPHLDSSSFGSDEVNHAGQQFVLSATGTHLALGGDGATLPTRVLTYDEMAQGAWRQVATDLELPQDQDQEEEEVFDRPTFRHVALSSDGRRVVVASPKCPKGPQGLGTVSVFEESRSDDAWNELGTLDLHGGTYCSALHGGLALSGDGQVLAVATVRPFYFDEDDPTEEPMDKMYVRVYRYHHPQTTNNDDADSWQLWGDEILVNTANPAIGLSLSLSFTGDRLAIGSVHFKVPATATDFSLHDIYSLHQQQTTVEVGYASRGFINVYQFGRSAAEKTDAEARWVRLGDEFVGHESGDTSGWTVALSSDGRRLAVGAPFSNLQSDKETAHGSGKVRVYEFTV